MNNINAHKIAVVVPVYNRRETTLNYLRQMQGSNTGDACLDIVIVDDGSTDDTADAVRNNYPNAVILKGDGNLWWTGAVNMGVEYALENSYGSVLIMNDDLELDRDFLVHLLDIAKRNPGALVSSVTVNKMESGREEILTAGFRRAGFFGDIRTLHVGELYSGNLEDEIKSDLLTGASLLVPTDVFRKIGIFDARNFPHGMGDFEFTLRASHNGYPCFVASKSKVYTEYNQNYPAWYFFHSTRREYLRNLFNSTKFYYGFKSIYRTSFFMHRSMIPATLLYVRRMVGLARSIFLKLFLTKNRLRKYQIWQARKAEIPESVIDKMKAAP
jgi:GT2 family glycosyltransferase